MKFYWKIPAGLKENFNSELQLASLNFNNGNIQTAWRHLERAHILGQAWPVEHTKAHWKMLLFGFRIKNFMEVLGQIPRLFLGGVKSFVGEIPQGNSGSSNVHQLKPMEIPPDLKDILRLYK